MGVSSFSSFWLLPLEKLRELGYDGELIRTFSSFWLLRKSIFSWTGVDMSAWLLIELSVLFGCYRMGYPRLGFYGDDAISSFQFFLVVTELS